MTNKSNRPVAENLYAVHGLCIKSEIQLPEFENCPCSGEVHARIVRSPVRWGQTAISSSLSASVPGTRNFLYNWENTGAIEVTDGSLVKVDAVPGQNEILLRHRLIGEVMAGLLHQRGVITLPGCSFRTRHGAIALISWPRWARFAMAEEMDRRRYALLAEGLVSVEQTRRRQMIAHPGATQLNPWKDMVMRKAGESENPRKEAVPAGFEGLTGNPSAWEPVLERGSSPLNHIFFLQSGSVPMVVPLSIRETFKRLIQLSFASRSLGPGVLTHAELRRNLQLATAASGSLVTVRTGDSLDSLVDLMEKKFFRFTENVAKPIRRLIAGNCKDRGSSRPSC